MQRKLSMCIDVGEAESVPPAKQHVRVNAPNCCRICFICRLHDAFFTQR